MMQDNNQDFHAMLPIGAELQMGKYRVERYLSSGGFGNTYVVRNVEFDELLAVKEFFMKGINERDKGDSTHISVSNPTNSEQFDQQREKFKKEARRLRSLHNRHLVKVHDLFEENGTAYYVMDYVEGESLSALLKRTGKPMSEHDALRILSEVLEGLEEVHKQKIWHLDLKPGNIMLDKTGSAILIDFGASKQLTASGYATSTVSMCYTPGYAPSEQVDQNIERIGPWTDLYALGATLYNILTRNNPPAISDLSEPDAFSYPPTVSANMRKLIEWMMNPGRQRRPQSIDVVRNYLRKMPEAAFLFAGSQPVGNQFVNTGNVNTGNVNTGNVNTGNKSSLSREVPPADKPKAPVRTPGKAAQAGIVYDSNGRPMYMKRKSSSSTWLKGCLIGALVMGVLCVLGFIGLVILGMMVDDSDDYMDDDDYGLYDDWSVDDDDDTDSEDIWWDDAQ